jgi:hypothetical protein
MDRLKLSTKLVALILICTLGMALMGILGVYQMKVVNNTVEKMYLEYIRGLTLLGELKSAYEEISKLTLTYQNSDSIEDWLAVEEQINSMLIRSTADVSKFYSISSDAAIRERMDDILKNLAIYNKYRYTVVDEKKREVLQSDLTELFVYQENIRKSIKNLEEYHEFPYCLLCLFFHKASGHSFLVQYFG